MVPGFEFSLQAIQPGRVRQWSILDDNPVGQASPRTSKFSVDDSIGHQHPLRPITGIMIMSVTRV